MKKLILYCKSYKNDVLRVKRLAVSIAKYNVKQIPFYVSVPTADMPLFQKILAGENVTLLEDEAIICANPALD